MAIQPPSQKRRVHFDVPLISSESSPTETVHQIGAVSPFTPPRAAWNPRLPVIYFNPNTPFGMLHEDSSMPWTIPMPQYDVASQAPSVSSLERETSSPPGYTSL